MHGRRFVRVVAGALVGLTAAIAHADTITLDEALRRAVARPTVTMAAAETEAARGAARGARRPAYNPELGVAIGPARAGGVTLFEVEVGLSQTLERGGKRAARVGAAEAAVRLATAQQQVERTLAALEAWRAFELALVERDRVAAARAAEQVATEVGAATEQTRALGKGTQLEVNLTTAEIGRATHERVDAENAYEATLAALATAIGAGAADRVEPQGDVPAPAELPWTEDAFVELALRNRAELVVARAALDAAGAEVRVADAGAVADVTVGLSYGFAQDPDVDTHALLVSASMALPIRNRHQGARAATRALVRRAQLDDARVRAEVEREARLAYQTYVRARSAVLAFDLEVIGKLHDNLELARESFQSGKLDYFAFSQVRRDLIASQRDYLHAIEEAVLARYGVLRAAGADTP